MSDLAPPSVLPRSSAQHVPRTASTGHNDPGDPANRSAPALHRIAAWRVARIAFGAVLLAGAVALVAAITDGRPDGDHQLCAMPVTAAQIIGGAWLAAAIAGLASYAIARLGRWSALATPLEASWVLPVLAIALLAPLTLHLLVAVLSNADDLRSFDSWVGLSLGITGIAHVVFAALSVRRARQLVRGATTVISPLRIYGLTFAASCVPFAVLFMIPPGLVALTGLPILPLLHAMEPAIKRDLAALPPPPPRAVATRSRSDARPDRWRLGAA